MATGVNQAALANLRKQTAQLSHDLEEFRIDHVAAIDYGQIDQVDGIRASSIQSRRRIKGV